MTNIRNDNKKSKAQRNCGIYTIHPVKSVCDSENVLRPNFNLSLKRDDTNTALTHEQIAGQTANFRNTNGDQSEKETDPGSQEEADLEQEERSDPKEE